MMMMLLTDCCFLKFFAFFMNINESDVEDDEEVEGKR
jgi:hypothetical protein